MANFRSIYKVQVFLTILVHLTVALYEDQVGKFDWKRSFVGKVKFVTFEAKRIIVATEENVLASLNLKTGDIEWRQVLENPVDHQIQVLQVNNKILTISGSKNVWLVRTWEVNTGTLLSEWSVAADPTVPSLFTAAQKHIYHIVPVNGSHIEVTTYPIKISETDKLPKAVTRQISAPWLRDLSNCVTSASHFVCIASNQFHYVDLTATENVHFESKSPQEFLNTQSISETVLIAYNHEVPGVLLVQNNVAKLAVFEEDTVKVKPFNLMPNAIHVKENDADVIYQLEANTHKGKLIQVKALDYKTGKDLLSLDLEYPVGLGAPIILGGQNRGSSTDLLLGTTDNALLLVRLPEGKIFWTREEALSSIVAVEFLELPVSELDASIEHEFDNDGGIFTQFFNRISTQSKQLYNLFFGHQLLQSSGLVRDDFGLHKIIVVATRAGKLFALDTLTGSIAWSYRLPNIQPFFRVDQDEKMLLFVQRTAQYSPLPAQCVLLAQDSRSGTGVIFQFDPISGHSVEGIKRLDYKIAQAVLLPQHDKDFLKPLLVMSDQEQVFLYPPTDISIVNFANTFMYLVDSSNAKLTGYSLKYSSEEALRATPVWEVKLPAGSKLVDVCGKPLNERVHSQGKVLFDRSVYYKYVNPNLLALAALSPDPMHRSVLSVYLIDGVTGLVVQSTSHKRAKGPVHLVHSENWLVYSYFSERFRRTEITAIELYEGHLQSNSTVFSSFAVQQLPDAQSQSYILPAVPLHVTVTLTERGITNKFLLIALSNGAVVEIPWLLLQPRFPGMPCGPEESCIPYMPEIPLHPEATINYNQSLSRIAGIEVAPARLESTSHVLVHGLDMFYTRVAPSKTFDVLKEDFDHRLILLVLTGLIVATFATKHLAARKALKQAWK